MKSLRLFLFDILIILYLEILFAFLVFGEFPNNVIHLALFSIVIGIFLNIISSVFKGIGNRILQYTSLLLISFVFGAQLVYYKIYESIISFYSIMSGGQIVQFIDMILKIVFENIFGIVLIFIPALILLILDLLKIISFDKPRYKITLYKIVLAIVINIVCILSLFLSDNNDIYSSENLYFNTHAPTLTAKDFGIITTMRLDFKRYVFGFEEKRLIDDEDIFVFKPNNEKEKEKAIEYNILDIDFEKLMQSENNQNIMDIHKYFLNQEPTSKNEYTGMFKGKNLIVFVAEAFSNIAIREDVTPNLYKLYKEGFQFKNFYTPVFPVSTADGEYVADTSLLPKEGVWSLSKIDGNYMPYSYANVFKQLGYSANAYHNHTAKYYDRHKYISTMGYDSYLAVGTGLEKRMNTKLWPNSDYEMINVTIDDYINNNNFLAYYMTVSGHLNYTTQGNQMASRNWNKVKNLPYSNKAKGYLATQIELDKAIGEVLKRLEETGKLKDTVIAISGDHFPYGLTLEEINELSAYNRDDVFEKYNMPFLLWSGSMEEPVEIEKIGSSLDILPTILNLFGVEYDSRLLMGRDILSNSSPLVIFSNRSFITEKGRYNSITKEFISSTNETLDKEYISNINSVIYNKYQISRAILENDYYNTLR